MFPSKLHEITMRVENPPNNSKKYETIAKTGIREISTGKEGRCQIRLLEKAGLKMGPGLVVYQRNSADGDSLTAQYQDNIICGCSLFSIACLKQLDSPLTYDLTIRRRPSIHRLECE